jgi:hypothetical protein
VEKAAGARPGGLKNDAATGNGSKAAGQGRFGEGDPNDRHGVSVWASEKKDPIVDDAGVGGYYDPSTAQFLSIDPDVAETGEPYTYTGDDSLNESDPLKLTAGPHMNPQWVCSHLHRGRGCVREIKKQEKKCGVLTCFDDHLPPKSRKEALLVFTAVATGGAVGAAEAGSDAAGAAADSSVGAGSQQLPNLQRLRLTISAAACLDT